MAIQAARIYAARNIWLEDVAEAAERVDAKAVEAWVAERGERFAIDADALVKLADAGVSESIIDVVVAVSYPERFAIAGEAGASIGERVLFTVMASIPGAPSTTMDTVRLHTTVMIHTTLTSMGLATVTATKVTIPVTTCRPQ